MKRAPGPNTKTGGDPLVRDAMQALRRIIRALRLAATDVERAMGISVAQLFVLQQLAAGPRSINQLAEATATDPSTVSGVVHRLLARKLVSRKAAADDARRAEVSLTPSGTALLARAPGVPQDRMLEALLALPARERRGVAQGLIQIADKMGQGDPSFFFEE